MYNLPSIIVVACPDRDAGNDSEALGLVYSPTEKIKNRARSGLGGDICSLSLIYFAYLIL